MIVLIWSMHKLTSGAHFDYPLINQILLIFFFKKKKSSYNVLYWRGGRNERKVIWESKLAVYIIRVQKSYIKRGTTYSVRLNHFWFLYGKSEFTMLRLTSNDNYQYSVFINYMNKKFHHMVRVKKKKKKKNRSCLFGVREAGTTQIAFPLSAFQISWARDNIFMYVCILLVRRLRIRRMVTIHHVDTCQSFANSSPCSQL